MPLNNYPIVVAHADYSQPPVLNEPVAPVASQELAVAVSSFTKLKRKVKGTTLRPPPTNHPGIVAVKFVEPKNKGNSQSFHNGMGGVKQNALAPPDAGQLVLAGAPFCFAPGVDDPVIALQALNTAAIQQVTFELFCKKAPATVIQAQIWAGADLNKLLTHPITLGGTVFRGSLKFSEVFGPMNIGLTLGGDPHVAFPDGVLTAHYSPYQLKVSVQPILGQTAYPSVAWTYIHVVAHAINLDWFSFPTQNDEKLALFLPIARRKREMAIYASLKDKKEDYNLRAQFPATGDVKKIPLDANRFYVSEPELQDNTGYEEWRTHWGDGPNIPIKATVLIRNMTGQGVSDPKALGNCSLVWSYKDAAQVMSAEGAGLGPVGSVPADKVGNDSIVTFITQSQRYLVAKPADDATPSGRNCHVHRGGKRGVGATPVFPTQAGAVAGALAAAGNIDTDPQNFPFNVTRCATRQWAVRSKFHSTGDLAGQTGVIFQPSRMGGDAYRLQVVLACSDLYADIDVNNEAALDAAPANLMKESGALETWRQVTFVKYLNGVDVTIDYDLVRQKMERNFMWLKVPFKKPEKLKMADFLVAYEQVRTDMTLPLLAYVRAAMLTPAQLTAAPVLDAKSDGNYGQKATAGDYLIPFLPFQLWKNEMITLHGTLAAAKTWGSGNSHPQPDYWVQRGGFRHPLAEDWPIQFSRVETGAGTLATVTVTIKPDHTRGDVLPLIVPNTKTADITNAAHLDDPGKLLLAPIFKDVLNHVSYFGGNHYRPANNGADNRDNIPHNTRILVEVTGNTVPQTLFNEIRDAVNAINVALGEEGMRSQYTTACGYQWVFTLLAMVNAQLVGPGAGGLTAVSLPADTLTNFRHPNGKAMFADVSRATACIPIMNSNDDTLYHEFLHSLFLNHPHEAPNDLYKMRQNNWTGDSIMVTGNRLGQMDGLHMLRTRGWSVIETDAAGAVPGGCYPGNPGSLPAPAVGDNTEQNLWWNNNCGGANRTLFGDCTQNTV